MLIMPPLFSVVVAILQSCSALFDKSVSNFQQAEDLIEKIEREIKVRWYILQ